MNSSRFNTIVHYMVLGEMTLPVDHASAEKIDEVEFCVNFSFGNVPVKTMKYLSLS